MPVLRKLVTILSVMAGLAAVVPRSVDAQQELAYSDRAPRFLAFVDGGVKPVDVKRTAVLNQRLALDLDGVTVKAALEEILARSSLRLVYREELLPVNATVHLRASEITVAAALAAVLLDAGVDVAFDRSGGAVLVRRSPDGRPPMGAIAGLVTDTKTGAVLSGATIVVEGTSRSATSGTDGRYRITEVAPGTYTVRARYIGYTPGTASVTVSAGEEATADFALEKSVQKLNEVVTTGTMVPTEVRALPTPVSVITDAQIQEYNLRRVDQVLRQFVPASVSWDLGYNQQQTVTSVRGASSISSLPGLKVYVDGIETSNASFAIIDPASVERIEVIRGPEAAAVYGSDAISGVMQVFTKKGDASLTRPSVAAKIALGAVQSQYASAVLRQDYSALVRGGDPSFGFTVGGGYSHTGDWLPNYSFSNPSGFGALHGAQGPVVVDISGRYFRQNTSLPNNPLTVAAGSSVVPLFEETAYSGETYGARVGFHATPRWEHSLTLGIDRLTWDDHNTQPRRTTPEDTLLFVDLGQQRKASIAYNTTLSAPLGANFTAVLTGGFDHYALTSNEYYTFDATRLSGTIDGALSATRLVTHNTGYFAQARLDLRHALFITAGVRAEENTGFGDSVGARLSPRVGLSYVYGLGGATLKVRGSYGEAIRPPNPLMKVSDFTNPYSHTLGNDAVLPERQTGADVGVDISVGQVASLGLTYYHQMAKDLIQRVLISSGDPPVYQFQNVGEIKNEGLELEGALNLGKARVDAQYAVTSSTLRTLPADYAGELRVGDQILGIPKRTGALSVAYTPFAATRLALGVIYIGSWTEYSYRALFTESLPSLRDYWRAYPGFAKINLNVSQDIRRGLSAFATVENLSNNRAIEQNDYNVTQGRMTTIGVRAVW